MKDIWWKLDPNNVIAVYVESVLACIGLSSVVMPGSLKILSCLYLKILSCLHFLAPSELFLESQIPMLGKKNHWCVYDSRLWDKTAVTKLRTMKILRLLWAIDTATHIAVNTSSFCIVFKLYCKSEITIMLTLFKFFMLTSARTRISTPPLQELCLLLGRVPRNWPKKFGLHQFLSDYARCFLQEQWNYPNRGCLWLWELLRPDLDKISHS